MHLAAKPTASSSVTSRRQASQPALAVPCAAASRCAAPAHATRLGRPAPGLLHQDSKPVMRCSATSEATNGKPLNEDDVVRVATIGDTVSIHYVCKNKDGEILDSSHDHEALSFELGAGEVMGNKLFQGFDEAVRGLAVGQRTVIEATGGDWQRELLFAVPRDHPEVARLEGRYKNQGGLQKDMLVELANGAMAVVVDVTDSVVKLDANNMMAGKVLTFEIELVDITKPSVDEA